MEDEPRDHEAVTLGVELWDKYQGNMTFAQLESTLGSYINKIARRKPLSRPVSSEVVRAWPYKVEYFNNGPDVPPYNSNKEQP